MAVKFAATTNAINRGLESMRPTTAVHLLEDWETALSDVETPGAKGILRDLAALRKQLEKSEPDADRTLALIHRLGAATSKIADKAEGSQEKLKALGEALTEAGAESHDEAHDEEAAKAPKRAPKKKAA